ncbi:protein kinase domain-containing protein [Pendulispora albinea]|uniref:Serine/threonine-protein kinase n=1 Tax=Pendulispora albinea TaxID=2741071 RepID=A0ABZ2LLE6_9BACT
MALPSYPTVFALRFDIEREGGVGGMGIVYRAFDRVTAQTVALKVLRKTGPTALKRFAVEADALENLHHPGIVRYVAHGVSDDGEPYLAMEWVEGESLGARLTRAAADEQPLGVRDVARLGARIAAALDTAHRIGIVHRDVKPTNILLEGARLDAPKLADFGIARMNASTHETTSGVLVGTVGYLAPEQAHRDVLDGRADLFALGCVLFRCLTNKEAFEGSGMMTILAKLLLHDPPRIRDLRPDVPAALDELVAQLLAKDPDRRPASAASVEAALEQIATSPEHLVTMRRRRPWSLPRWWNHRANSALLVVLLAVIPAGVVLRGIASRPPPTAIPSRAQAAPSAMAITQLAASPSCAAEAVRGYEQGLQALHEASWPRAHFFFDEASRVDPTCPQVQLRALITGETEASSAQQKESLRRATALRDKLSERDRIVLDAYAANVASDPPRVSESVQILESAVRRFPDDAELRVLLVLRKLDLAPGLPQLEEMLDLLGRALRVDPTYADAWQMRGRILGQLRRYDEQLDAIDCCLQAAPNAVDCMTDRIQALRRRGRCSDAASEARRRIAWDEREERTHWYLAINLASSGARREAIDEALHVRWELLPPEKRVWMIPSDRARIAAWEGNFSEVLHELQALADGTKGSIRLEAHVREAVLSVDVLRELGRDSEAALVAARFLERAKVWVKSEPRVSSPAYHEPQFLAAELEGEKLTPDQWRAASTAWAESTQSRMNDFERWVLGWASAVGSKIRASEALEREPPAAAGAMLRSSQQLTFLFGFMEAYEGRLRLYANDARAAVPLLEAAAQSCNSLDFPFLNVRSHLWLGMAKEKLADVAGACAAYGFVIDRWGAARPESVTARDAKRRSRALGCAH